MSKIDNQTKAYHSVKADYEMCFTSIKDERRIEIIQALAAERKDRLDLQDSNQSLLETISKLRAEKGWRYYYERFNTAQASVVVMILYFLLCILMGEIIPWPF